MLVSFATSQYKTAGILDGIQKNKSDHYYGRCYRKQDEILAEFLMGLMLSKLQNEFVLAICMSYVNTTAICLLFSSPDEVDEASTASACQCGSAATSGAL